MNDSQTEISDLIPVSLHPYFKEYDILSLDLNKDATLIISRTLEFGDWNDVTWLYRKYKPHRIRVFLRQHGERLLRPVTFNYWRKLMRIHKWRTSPFPTPRAEVWNR